MEKCMPLKTWLKRSTDIGDKGIYFNNHGTIDQEMCYRYRRYRNIL